MTKIHELQCITNGYDATWNSFWTLEPCLRLVLDVDGHSSQRCTPLPYVLTQGMWPCSIPYLGILRMCYTGRERERNTNCRGLSPSSSASRPPCTRGVWVSTKDGGPSVQGSHVG